MIKVVALDCDGVVLESMEAKTRAYASLVSGHGSEATARMIGFFKAHGGYSRYELFRWFYKEVLGQEITPEESDDLAGRFRALCLEEVSNAPFVPGAREFITRHHDQYPLYAVSGTPEAELPDIFAYRRLNGYFREVCGSPTKKPAIINRILRENGISPKELLFVGDSQSDLDAAKETGVLFFGRGPFEPPIPWADDLTLLEVFIRRVNAKA